MMGTLLALRDNREILCANIDCNHIMTDFELSIMMKRPSRSIFCLKCKRIRRSIPTIRCINCGTHVNYINSDVRFYCRECRRKHRNEKSLDWYRNKRNESKKKEDTG